MINILLAEDHGIVRQGLRTLLQQEADFRLAGEAADGMQAATLTEQLRPDVLVLDLSLPRLHGLDVIRRVRRETKTRVVVLTMHTEESYVIDSLRTGALGYVFKNSPSQELFAAIRSVAHGNPYLASDLRQGVFKKALLASAHAASYDVVSFLSGREREVLELAAQGLNNNQIAQALFISHRTVESHRASLLRKLSLQSQTDLVHFAIRHRIIEV